MPQALSSAGPERLDLLAVAAGEKPLCLLANESAAALAAATGLPSRAVRPWSPAGIVPDWYEAARRRLRRLVLAVARDEDTLDRAQALSVRGRIGAEEEAAILGYPLCCVAQHHARALALENLVAAMAARGGDAAQAARLIAAGIDPTPLTQSEWERYAALAAAAPLPLSGIVPCEACAADPLSPARAIEARYAARAGR
jgi:hypothetical protein